MKRLLLSITIGTLLTATTLFAHHSLGATYDNEKEVKLDGKIVQFLMRNPHSFLHVEAKDEKGVVQRWSLEWRSAGASPWSRAGSYPCGKAAAPST